MQATVDKQVIETLKAIEENIRERPYIPFNKLRWNSTACAVYLNLKGGPKYFMQNIACQASFPDPVKPKLGDGKRGRPLWLADDVIKWLESQK